MLQPSRDFEVSGFDPARPQAFYACDTQWQQISQRSRREAIRNLQISRFRTCARPKDNLCINRRQPFEKLAFKDRQARSDDHTIPIE